MADDVPVSVLADDDRVAQLLESLERLAGGDLEHAVPISPVHDALDAIAFGVNVLVGELRYAGADLRRAKEEAEQANRAKSVFLRNVSHEIRTPLSAILALAQLLCEPALDEARRVDLVQRVQSNARALIALVDDLLDLARVEADKLSFDIGPMSPLETVNEVVHSLELQAQKKGLRVLVESAPGTPAHLASDARRVRQVLTNVIGNALKFTERGEIRVQLHPLDEERLAIDVQDTGPGLSDAQRGELFQPFQQADPSIAHNYGGTGLGLVLSQRLARGLGGELSLEASAPGAGSTFRLCLPMHRASRVPAAAAESPQPVPPSRPLAGMRLLLADDNPDIRLAIAELLEFGGAQIVQVEDGGEALERALEGRFDAVLMDVRMPGVDGLQAVRTLRQRGCRLPIVALTADAVKEHRADCLAAGYDDYVAKPVEYRQLVEVVLRNRAA